MVRKVPDFNNRESRVEVTNLTHGLTGFTLEAWLACPARTRTATTGILTYRANARADTEWYGLFIDTTKGRPGRAHLRFVLGKGTTTTVDIQTADGDYSAWAKKWRHVAVSYNGTNALVYLDGQPVATTVASGGGTFIPRDRGLVFGSYNCGTKRIRFRGLISEVRLWNVVRSASDINTGRFCPLSLDDSLDCLGYWPMDEGMGTLLNDRTQPVENGTSYDIPGWVDWNDKAGGSFMEDMEDALEIKEDQIVLTEGDISDWGTNVAKDTKRNLSIRNKCTHCDVDITEITTNPADFTLSNAPAAPITLKPAGGIPNTLDTDVVFSPRREGLRSSQVKVKTNRPFYEPFAFTYNVKAEYVKKLDQNMEITVAGSPVTPGMAKAFNQLNRGDTRTLVITNTGDGTLSLSNFGFSSGTDFTLTPVDPNRAVPIDLAKGEQVNYLLTFNPQSEGNKEAELSIESNDSQNPFTFKVSALYNVDPAMSVAIDGVAIGNGHRDVWGQVESGKTKTLTIANHGQDTLKISRINISPAGPFTLSPRYARGVTIGNVAGNNSKALTLTFDGQGLSTDQSAVITIVSDDPNTPNFSFTLTAREEQKAAIQVIFNNRDMTYGGTEPWPRNIPESGDVIEIRNPTHRAFTLQRIEVSPSPFEILDPYGTIYNLRVDPVTSSGAVYRYQFTIMYRAYPGRNVTGTVKVYSDDPVLPVVTFQIQAR